VLWCTLGSSLGWSGVSNYYGNGDLRNILLRWCLRLEYIRVPKSVLAFAENLVVRLQRKGGKKSNHLP